MSAGRRGREEFSADRIRDVCYFKGEVVAGHQEGSEGGGELSVCF
jgi:hypothetical protein